MGTEADDLAAKLETYILQLRQVEAALDHDPTHIELLKIKADLNELIDLARNRLKEKIEEGVPLTKKARVTSSSSRTASTSEFNEIVSGSSASAEEYQDKIVSRIKTLKDDNYRDFLFQVFDEYRPPDILKAIIKRYTNRGKKSIKRQLGGSRLKEDDHDDTGEANHCNGSADPATNGREVSRSAWKAPLIFRGDMLPAQDGLLFMTVKKISLKAKTDSHHKAVPAVVCIVNFQKNLVFWSLINWKKDEVCETMSNNMEFFMIDSLANGLPLDQVPSPFSQDAKDTGMLNSVIEACKGEIQCELGDLAIDLNSEDIKCCSMLHYWRKKLAEMRRPDNLNLVLPTKTMAKLSKLRNVTDDQVKTIMKDEDCITPYNNDQVGILLKIVNEGDKCFEKMVTSFCNRCAGRGHIAKICTRLKDKKAVDEYYKLYHPEMVIRQQKRRKFNSHRNKRLRMDEAAAVQQEKSGEDLERRFEAIHDKN